MTRRIGEHLQVREFVLVEKKNAFTFLGSLPKGQAGAIFCDLTSNLNLALRFQILFLKFDGTSLRE